MLYMCIYTQKYKWTWVELFFILFCGLWCVCVIDLFIFLFDVFLFNLKSELKDRSVRALERRELHWLVGGVGWFIFFSFLFTDPPCVWLINQETWPLCTSHSTEKHNAEIHPLRYNNWFPTIPPLDLNFRVDYFLLILLIRLHFDQQFQLRHLIGWWSFSLLVPFLDGRHYDPMTTWLWYKGYRSNHKTQSKQTQK